MVDTGRASPSSATTRMRSGLTMLAHVNAAGPKADLATTSRDSDASSGCNEARCASFWPTSRTFSELVTPLPPWHHDPAGGHPGHPLIRELHSEPVSALADDLQFRSIRNLVDNTRRDGWSAAGVRRIHSHHRNVLRHRRDQCHTNSVLDNLGWFLHN